jgi:hypothetical protein
MSVPPHGESVTAVAETLPEGQGEVSRSHSNRTNHPTKG